MDIQTMHVAVDLGLQRIASHTYDDFLPQEIDLYLNRATRKYVEAQKDAIISSEGGDVQARLEALRTLIISTSITDGTDHPFLSRCLQFPTPPTFAYFISARVKADNKWKKTLFVSPTLFDAHAETATDQPLFTVAPVTLESGKVSVIQDMGEEGEIDELGLTYVKSPAILKLDVENDPPTNVSSDLPAHTHQDIVDLAVEMMLGDLAHGQPKPPAAR